MPTPQRAEVWLADLGIAAKIRPALILSVPPGPQDRVLVTLVPHTTSLHGTRFEVAIPKKFLRACEKIKTVSRKVAKAPRIPKNSWLSFLLLGVFATLREIFSQTLSPGAFDAQGLVTVASARLMRKLGDLQVTEMAQMEEAVRRWLSL